ncbi:MAG: cytochrome b/b6 domain-containing protein [Bacteroidetes bacterium]|nr:cytochrome b/b6 domain-containing protein [Bacteroidota bacterium]
MESKLYLYPVWLRIWHAINAVLFLVLIATGLSLQYVSPDYSFVDFEVAVSTHNISGIVITIAYFMFVFGNLFTKNGKFYKIKRKRFFNDLFAQIKYYSYGIFVHQKSPFPVTSKRKFNPLQKLSYVGAMYFLFPILILSGLALIFPEFIVPNVFGFSGIHLTGLVHIISGFGLSIFLCIHLYFCTIGKTPTSNFKSMIDGYH